MKLKKDMREEKEYIETTSLKISFESIYYWIFFKLFNIGIVGAGIGGLSSALMLKTCGHDVTIFEKKSESFSSGVGIQLSSNAIRILRKFWKSVEYFTIPL